MVVIHDEKSNKEFDSIIEELIYLGKKTTLPIKDNIYNISIAQEKYTLTEISIVLLKCVSLFTNFPYDRIRYGDLISVLKKLKEFKEQVKDDFYIAMLKNLGEDHEH